MGGRAIKIGGFSISALLSLFCSKTIKRRDFYDIVSSARDFLSLLFFALKKEFRAAAAAAGRMGCIEGKGGFMLISLIAPLDQARHATGDAGLLLRRSKERYGPRSSPPLLFSSRRRFSPFSPFPPPHIWG